MKQAFSFLAKFLFPGIRVRIKVISSSARKMSFVMFNCVVGFSSILICLLLFSLLFLLFFFFGVGGGGGFWQQLLFYYLNNALPASLCLFFHPFVVCLLCVTLSFPLSLCLSASLPLSIYLSLSLLFCLSITLYFSLFG